MQLVFGVVLYLAWALVALSGPAVPPGRNQDVRNHVQMRFLKILRKSLILENTVNSLNLISNVSIGARILYEIMLDAYHIINVSKNLQICSPNTKCMSCLLKTNIQYGWSIRASIARHVGLFARKLNKKIHFL